MPRVAKGVWSAAPARVTVVAGRASSGKTTRLLDQYRRRLSAGPPGVGLWLAPHQRGVAEIRGRLLDPSLPACLAPNVMTFDQFADSVLAAAEHPVRPLDPLVQRRLVARWIEAAREQGRLKHFASIADRPGLVDLCLGFIAEMKRLEIWPGDFAKACQKRGLGEKDRELLALYEHYQQTLVEHNLYDFEGRHWAARHCLEQGSSPRYEPVRLVIADGFTDFTRTQHGVLRALAAGAEEIVITLPLEQDDERSELFVKTRQTLERLRSWQPKLSLEWLEPRSSTAWPALQHVEAHVFGNPRTSPPPPATAGIEIIAAARPLDELQAIGRQIKRLLLDGDAPGRRVSPADVVVVFRRVEDSAALVSEVFDELGLPYAIESGETLRQSSALTALLGVLNLQREDWPFRRLLAVLANTFLQPGWSRAGVAAAERTIRELQIPSGRKRLLDHLTRWVAQEPVETEGGDEDESLARRRQRYDRAQQALQILRPLGDMFDRLPQRATPAQWSQALRGLATALGIDRSIQAGMNDRPELARRERAAFGKFFESLTEQDQAWADLGEPPPTLDFDALLELADDVLGGQRIPRSHDESGCIRVLSATSIRSLHVPYLFVANLAEKSFPPPERDDRLYDESEQETLQRAGLPLVLHTERSAEEMLLFYEVITRATRRLVLSYPGLDDKAQPLLPSPYLAEVLRLCGREVLDERGLADLSPLPPEAEPLSPAEARVLAVHRATGDEADLFASLFADPGTREVARSVAAALESIESRGDREQYGIFEGLLTSDAARRKLHELFASERRWTASQLEDYRYCPYQFFLRHVLGLEPLPELSLDVDYMTRGRLVHAVLAEVHKRLKDADPSGQAVSDVEAISREFDAVMSQVKLPRFGDLELAEAFDELDRRLLQHWKPGYLEHLAKYVEQQKAGGVPLSAAHFEVSFGLSKKSSDVLSTTEPYTLRHRDEEFRFAGRIDRIDLGAIGARPVFGIVDYKLSRDRNHGKSVLAAKALQLTLYAMAVEEHLLRERGAIARGVGYWYIKEKGYDEMLRMCEPAGDGPQLTDEWQSLRPLVLDTVWSLVHDIRDGMFPVACEDENCAGRCDFGTVCRVTQIRSLEKTWQPPQPSV